MSRHETTVLTHHVTGDTVAYLAPGFDVQRTLKVQLDGDEPASLVHPFMRLFEQRKVVPEVRVRGRFRSSDDLPPDHATDLEQLFGKSVVTEWDQINRLTHYQYVHRGPYNLDHREDTYRHTEEADVDIRNGEYPTVFLKDFRPDDEAGHAIEFVLTFFVARPV
ncbi:hypothetical protein BRD56_05460 [Thermoplasmatales archaeon SW_10_69_26]|nr:MAG: hypothetical protein BRD56_05460 [Thermoplasmatales archaeon SW_10_69_26]